MTVGSVSADAPIDPVQLKRAGAAKDFEALLIGQMLKSVREEGSGWLGTGEDQADDAAFSLGEQELSKALSKSGGIGLSKLIDAGLQARAAKADAQAETANRAGSSIAPAPGRQE